jgi:hypothetical protein
MPFDVRIKAVTLDQQHPMWSVKMTGSKTTRLLTSKLQLWRWKEQVESGRSDRDKYTMINAWTYDQFTEARLNKLHVTTRTQQQWGMASPI